MKIKVLIALCLLLQTNYFYSQLKGSSYQFPEKFSPNYFFDPNKEYLTLKNIQPSGFTAEQIDFYKIQNTYGIQRDFDYNSYYLEWYDLEKYLKKLVDTILPFELKNKQIYNTFISRDVDFNAKALRNGFIFIDIGLLAGCKNEAELAYVIGHKIGHSLYNQEYLITSNVIPDLKYTGKTFGREYSEYKQMQEENLKGETKSDSFAYQCLNKAKLSTKNISNANFILQYNEYAPVSYMNRVGSGSYDVSKNYTGSYLSTTDRKKK